MFIKSQNKRPGFVLYEAVVALMITIMTLGILQQSLQILHRVQQTTFRDQLRWHITQEKLQELLGRSKLWRVDEDIIIYQNGSKEDRMVLDVYNSNGGKVLRKTTATQGGYEPMMTNLKTINIEKKDKLVIITTENKAGQTSQMCLINDP